MARKQNHETAIQRSVLAALRLWKIAAWRTNAAGGSQFGRMASNPGFPDIVAIEPGTGRFVGIECKVPGSKGQNPDQLRVEATIVAAGGRYEIVTSVEDLFKIGMAP